MASELVKDPCKLVRDIAAAGDDDALGEGFEMEYFVGSDAMFGTGTVGAAWPCSVAIRIYLAVMRLPLAKATSLGPLTVARSRYCATLLFFNVSV